MSKIEAYICNYCNKIVPANNAVGIIAMRDLFDHSADYPTCDAGKADVHHCLDCSHSVVIIKAEELSPRMKDERAYQIRFHELYSIFKGHCVTNWLSASRRNKQKYSK